MMVVEGRIGRWMALRGSDSRVRVLYDFESQPGTGELSIKEGEILTVTRQDVGEGWWEGSNAFGQAGLFPAAYVEEVTATAPPPMPPPPLPTEYANVGDEWVENRTNLESNNWNASQDNKATSGFNVNAQRRPVSQQMSYDNDDWDDDWDDDDSEPGNNYLNGAGNFGLSAPNRAAKSSSSVGDVSTAGGGMIKPTNITLGEQEDEQTGWQEGRQLSERTGRDGRGTVRKSFNRFSNLAKSGVEDFLVGAGKASVDEKDKVFVEDYGNGPVWKPNSNEFTCAITSPKKESKFHGMKSFIAYTLMPSFSSTPVSRRYKHFDWIQGRLSEKFPLIPIPPLPEKQISGRFEDDLIEYRMTMLQSWVDRICRHPVISQCEVFHHFVTCPNDEKLWKTGKRRAESDKLVGANFYLAIERPDTALDVMQTEAKLEGYNRFFSNLDESVKLLQNTCMDQAKKHQTAFKREYNKISHSFSKLSRAFDTDPSNCAPGLTEAIHHMSEAYSDIGTVFEEEPKHDWDPLCHLLFEYRGLIDGFPSVISITKGAIAKRRQVEKEANEGRLDYDQVPPMVRRSDTIAYALHAEVAHFHQERTRDFKKAMTSFLTEQINFYQKITDRLRESLEKFNDV
ncbi:sorting nexin lst-4 isoform X4 [Cherax quadricarinatus]|uniref:sorting nexin lst-4 isoform X4 n=1 Tax=Cherax quadricarinatus TaxID=27406 RepID=UPI0023799888|nr:sorting nexin lst-4-like isoform X1 [Cherax quadricarinatus]XP_053648366.1 sorting nexin lst-4-like isoform X1 [Cherax quadricarinatus]XP_053648367.1 sorting nexin lst-4-like isoform X1 [Cherax quadricarinatus]